VGATQKIAEVGEGWILPGSLPCAGSLSPFLFPRRFVRFFSFLTHAFSVFFLLLLPNWLQLVPLMLLTWNFGSGLLGIRRWRVNPWTALPVWCEQSRRWVFVVKDLRKGFGSFSSCVCVMCHSHQVFRSAVSFLCGAQIYTLRTTVVLYKNDENIGRLYLVMNVKTP
jgi:hypothetical protein